MKPSTPSRLSRYWIIFTQFLPYNHPSFLRASPAYLQGLVSWIKILPLHNNPVGPPNPSCATDSGRSRVRIGGYEEDYWSRIEEVSRHHYHEHDAVALRFEKVSTTSFMLPCSMCYSIIFYFMEEGPLPPPSIGGEVRLPLCGMLHHVQYYPYVACCIIPHYSALIIWRATPKQYVIVSGILLKCRVNMLNQVLHHMLCISTQ